MTDDNKTNEVVTLAILVGYCLSTLNSVATSLGENEVHKASNKVYEAIKFIKDRTNQYNATIDLPNGVEHE